MSISERKHVLEGEAPARRVEIFTGAGRRRSWSAREKASIVAESFEEGVRACHVARRRGLTPQQLFAWRREARRKAREGWMRRRSSRRLSRQQTPPHHPTLTRLEQ